MLGLFGTLNMAARSLQVQRQGVEVAGHNLANVNNPAYARQRLSITTSATVPTLNGPQGTGADVVAIRQLRSALLDRQLQAESTVKGFLEAQQSALQLGQSVLGQEIDRASTGPEGSAAAQGAGSQSGLAEGLDDLFNAFQSLSTNPTSITERQSALLRAQNLASQFNQIDSRLATLGSTLNDTVKDDVAKANELVDIIANYNKQIIVAESGTLGAANDLRDLRQQRVEELSQLVNVQTVELTNGSLELSVSGTTLVSGAEVLDRLGIYDAGAGQLKVQSQTGGVPLILTGGSVQGTIAARDGALTALRNDLNGLASALITRVNEIHRSGFGLTGTTGASYFTGSNAADMAVNQTLIDDPSLLQLSGVNGEVGNNQVALALAQLSGERQTAMGNQTLSQNYSRTVASLGQSLWSVNAGLSDQEIVQKMLLRQRDSVGGVSMDEEMTDLIKFQTAFDASARLIATVDELLQTVINLKR